MTSVIVRQRSRPRKEARQARARHTVDAIIEAAARILEDQGHAGYTTNAVAEVAGVSIGTLYQYFPDKDALMGSLIARETERLLHEVEAASTRSDPHDALDGVIEAAVRHQVRRPNLARVLDFEEGRLPLDRETQGVRARFIKGLSGILLRLDLLQQADVATATVDVMAIMRGILDAAGDRGEKEPAALVARVRRAVLGYMSPSGLGTFNRLSP